MATVALFHSVYGLRPLEREAARRLRAGGHHVVTPDLYAGRAAATVEEGFAIKDEIGWATLCEWAASAIADLPPEAVLGGFSMGAGVAASLWPDRPQAAAILLLHSIAEVPANARPGTPVQVHLADPDPYEPSDEVAAWRASVAGSPIRLEVFTYPGAGHLFADVTLADHDAGAAALMWERVDRLLASL